MINVLATTMLLLLSPSGAINSSSGMTAHDRALLINDAAAMQKHRTEQTQQTESRNTSIWSHTDDGVKLEVRVEGKVEFTDDYTDVRSVSEDGLFQVIDERGGETRKLRVTRDASGGLRRTLSVNGHTREFDAEAAAWLSGILPE